MQLKNLFPNNVFTKQEFLDFFEVKTIRYKPFNPFEYYSSKNIIIPKWIRSKIYLNYYDVFESFTQKELQRYEENLLRVEKPILTTYDYIRVFRRWNNPFKTKVESLQTIELLEKIRKEKCK
jgi:hypothetical protein